MVPATATVKQKPKSPVYVFSAAQHSHLAPYLAALHGTCITSDYMTGAFLPPLDHTRLLAWWKERIAETSSGRLVILFLLDESEPGTRAKGSELVGAALLSLPPSETSPFRAHLETLLVYSKYRGCGNGRQLVKGAHAEAIKRGKTLVTAEAETGSLGEMALKKCSYTEAGRVPNYSFSPADMKKKSQTILYMELAG